jgi:hypothetical protein
MYKHQLRLGGTPSARSIPQGGNRPSPLIKEQFLGRLQSIVEPAPNRHNLKAYEENLRELSTSIDKYQSDEAKRDEFAGVGQILKKIIWLIRQIPNIGRNAKEN